jgi:hypothetical protein
LGFRFEREKGAACEGEEKQQGGEREPPLSNPNNRGRRFRVLGTNNPTLQRARAQ